MVKCGRHDDKNSNLSCTCSVEKVERLRDELKPPHQADQTEIENWSGHGKNDTINLEAPAPEPDQTEKVMTHQQILDAFDEELGSFNTIEVNDRFKSFFLTHLKAERKAALQEAREEMSACLLEPERGQALAHLDALISKEL